MFNSSIKENVKLRQIDDHFVKTTGHLETQTKKVVEFYQNNPFPNFDDMEDIFDLQQKLDSNPFVRTFKNFIGFNKKVLEVGSGTSQLTLSLAYGTNNQHFALDPSYEALRLANNFKKSNKVPNCFFVCADLFEDIFNPQYFDFIYCSGVLHHTFKPELAFKVVSNWLKPEGIIILGLYNLYGRQRTKIRQALYNHFPQTKKFIYILDPFLRTLSGPAKKEAWFRDQYEHPIESLHTLDEVFRWFSANNIRFLNSIPCSDLSLVEYQNLFVQKSQGTKLSRLLAQIFMIYSNYGNEGGLFLVMGKKNKLIKGSV